MSRGPLSYLVHKNMLIVGSIVRKEIERTQELTRPLGKRKEVIERASKHS